MPVTIGPSLPTPAQKQALRDAFDLCSLPALPLAADATAPDGFVVRQAGVWCVASYAQMQSWLGAAPAPATGGPVTVNGTPLTVNGEPITTGT